MGVRTVVDRRRRAAVIGAAIVLSAAASACGAQPWLVDVGPKLGLNFVYDSGTAEGHHMPQIAGGGVALFDYDNDGDLDAYLNNATRKLPSTDPDPEVKDRMFRQEADGRFVDVTVAAGLGDPYFSVGLSTGDYDNDGDQDLFVANFGPDQLYRNRGDGTFENVTKAAGITIDDWTAGSVFADYDRDGFLDLYLTRYVLFDPGRKCTAADGTPNWCGPSVFKNAPDHLLHNNGDGTFTEVSTKAGIDRVATPSLGVMADDYDGDGWIDFFVANDGSPAVLWHNQKDGTFIDVAVPWGAAVSAMGEPEAGMGIVSDDLTGDGLIDLVVTHVVGEKTTFYRALGPGAGFIDDSFAAGIGAPSRSVTGFGIAATDFELDGDLDLIQANGRVRRDQPILPGAIPAPPMDELAEPKQLYLNDGKGMFALQDPATCGACQLVEISRGLTVGDIDADGDQDVLILNLSSGARLLENQAPRKGKWLVVRAMEPKLKRAALGARVTVHAGGRQWSRTIHSSISLYCAQEPQAHFGLGPVDAVDAVDVRWPDGSRESFANPCVDCTVVLKHGEGTYQP